MFLQRRRWRRAPTTSSWACWWGPAPPPPARPSLTPGWPTWTASPSCRSSECSCGSVATGKCDAWALLHSRWVSGVRQRASHSTLNTLHGVCASPALACMAPTAAAAALPAWDASAWFCVALAGRSPYRLVLAAPKNPLAGATARFTMRLAESSFCPRVTSSSSLVRRCRFGFG